ncbi:NAD-dependent epimerase/dehydratase family protein [Kribbella sp. NPDC056951]|uniref:NAD-dependent epimerase/dehydratase family protein n=1 Tax=Kribbella sp. NPDC056951 TaxID=3345978 RepID=UPI00362845D2
MVTGVSRDAGARCARRLADDPSIGTVLGIDVVPPRAELGRVRFVRADIRNPVIAKVIAAEDVDTVVHTGVVATPGSAGGRSSMKEINVIGTMQLLAACQKAPGVAKLVVKSSTTVYGAGPRDPAMFTEEMAPRAIHQTGLSKDAVEVEGYVRGFARRRPDVCVTTLRMANWIGPKTDSPMTRYFGLPVVPSRRRSPHWSPRSRYCASSRTTCRRASPAARQRPNRCHLPAAPARRYWPRAGCAGHDDGGYLSRTRRRPRHSAGRRSCQGCCAPWSGSWSPRGRSPVRADGALARR